MRSSSISQGELCDTDTGLVCCRMEGFVTGDGLDLRVEGEAGDFDSIVTGDFDVTVSEITVTGAVVLLRGICRSVLLMGMDRPDPGVPGQSMTKPS